MDGKDGRNSHGKFLHSQHDVSISRKGSSRSLSLLEFFLSQRARLESEIGPDLPPNLPAAVFKNGEASTN